MNVEKILSIIALAAISIFALFEKTDSAIVPAAVAAILAIVHNNSNV